MMMRASAAPWLRGGAVLSSLQRAWREQQQSGSVLGRVDQQTGRRPAGKGFAAVKRECAAAYDRRFAGTKAHARDSYTRLHRVEPRPQATGLGR